MKVDLPVPIVWHQLRVVLLPIPFAVTAEDLFTGFDVPDGSQA